MKNIIQFYAGALILSVAMSVAAVESIEITIKDHKFSPEEITVPADTKVKLVIKNTDATPEEFESHTLHREKIIPGGKQAVIFIGPLSPGTYEFFGEFNPKTAKGRVIVK
jgi:hypothetical protein